MIRLEKRMRRMLFGLLSLFVLTIGFLYNYAVYTDTEARLDESLRQVASFLDRPEGMTDVLPYIPGMDVGVVLLTRDGQPIGVMTHDDNQTESDSFLEAAREIVSRQTPGQWQTGNLYQDGYAWNWSVQRLLAIADKHSITRELWEKLILSSLACILAEIILWILCRRVVRDMTQPIAETFDKQKRFIQDAGHELKTPLAIILASAETMETDPNPKWLANIKTESEKMDRLIKAMLDLSTSENPVELTDLNLSRTVEQAVLPYEALLFEMKCSLTLQLQPDVKIRGNREGINQLTGILLDNAIKHARTGTEVNVSVHSSRNSAFLEVTNQGDEIPKGEEEKIFDRFYRIDKARNRKSGRYGLGLAIAKNICGMHQAQIMARSSQGTTTFTVQFPLAKH